MKYSAFFGRKGSFLCLVFCLLAGLISGCTSAKLRQARNDFYSGHLDEAAAVLSDEDEIAGRDRLVLYLEKGLILHHNGNFQESIDTLLKATALIKEQEIISAGEQTGSLVTSERITSYKGEYAERLLAHTYLIMNFLMTGSYENALVEAKQALEVYETYPEACRDDYFTRALIAHCFEALGEINGAYIEYKKLAELMPDPGPVADKLCEIGSRLGFDDEVEIYSQYLPESERDKIRQTAPAELIVFISQGRSPEKIPHNIVVPPSIRFSFFTYKDRSGRFYPPAIRSISDIGAVDMITTDVGAILKASLQDRLAAVIAKETARVVAKEAIANNMDDPLVETLVRIAFFVMEEPDTRAWETLPAYLSMIRIKLPPGRHSIQLTDFNGRGGMVALPELETTPGRRFYHFSVRNSSRHANF